MNLAPRDLELFASLRVPIELLEQARLVRVTDEEARMTYGIAYKGDCSGVVFPYLASGNGYRATCRLRRDRPEIDEQGRPIAKYVAPVGDRHHLYLVPGSADRLGDLSATVVLVEAEKSALALHALADRHGRRWLLVGCGGCWGWRGQRGITENADGERVPERGPLPDLDLVTWAKRPAVILFDANVTTNPKVQAARTALAQELATRGSEVRLATLPVEDGINGPDDFLARHGDEATLEMIATAKKYRAPKASTGKANAATELVQLVEETGAQLFASPDGTPYLSLENSGHLETYAIRSRFVREWLGMLGYREQGKIPSAQTLVDATNALAGKARWDGEQIPVHVRVATLEDRILLDLGDATWAVVEITPRGWGLSTSSPVRFRRPYGVCALPAPVPGGEITTLRSFLNLATDDDFKLLVAWQLAALRGKGPYPVLALVGEQGSGKSMTAEVTRVAFDPNLTPLRGAPRDERDLYIAANNAHAIVLENLSSMPGWLSDALCRLASGAGFSTRTLFSDVDETIFTGARPIALNGIVDVVSRGDLLDRLISLETPVITDRRRVDEDRLRRQFAEAHPTILGALLDGISSALRFLPETVLEVKPRMADFSLWLAAAEHAYQWAGTVSIYMNNRQESVELLLSTDVLAETLREFMRSEETWEGSCRELLDALTVKVPERVAKDKHAWPQNPRQLSGILRRLAPQLRRVGLDVKLDEREAGTGKRLVTVTTVTTVTGTDQPDAQRDGCDGRDGPSQCSDDEGVVL